VSTSADPLAVMIVSPLPAQRSAVVGDRWMLVRQERVGELINVYRREAA